MYLAYTSLYFANWSEYHTRVMITQVGNIGVTEIQWISIAFLVLVGSLGNSWLQVLIKDVVDLPQFHDKENSLFWVGETKVNTPIIWILTSHGLFNLMFCIYNTLKAATDKFSAIRQLVPLGLIYYSGYLLFGIEEFHPLKGYVVLAISSYVSLIICKLIVSSLAQTPFSSIQPELFLLLALSAAAVNAEDLQTKQMVLITIIASGFSLFILFSSQVVNKIATVLKIKVFTV